MSSRRTFLAAAAALALPRALHARSTVFDADVAIVGAGAAGLAAARECERLGRSFVLMEARERVGGRVFTDISLGEPFDAGAVYIHWADANPWAEVARDLEVATVPDDGRRGGLLLYENGVRVERTPGRGAGFQRLGELVERLDAGAPDVSIADLAAPEGADVARAAASMARLSLGEDPQRVSAQDYARLNDGADLLLPGGYGTLVARYGAGLAARMGVRVERIDVSGAGVALDTSRGKLRAKAAIVTVSAGVLASGGIAFIPPLPAATQEAIAGLGMGVLTKIALKFGPGRFGIADGDDLFDANGAGQVLDFECWGFGRDLVVAHLGGDYAREVLALGRDGAVAHALERFAAIAGSDARRSFGGGAVADWLHDPFSLGSYSHCLPGQAGARGKLAAPVAEKLWFAGEATGGPDHGGAMTAGGAFLAGRDAARAAALLP